MFLLQQIKPMNRIKEAVRFVSSQNILKNAFLRFIFNLMEEAAYYQIR